MMALDALCHLLRHYNFHTVLDVGCGSQAPHSYEFHKAGKEVHAVDLSPPKNAPFAVYPQNYLNYASSDKQFDCVWASHVLEHQLNVHTFLTKIFYELKDGGIFAVTVPPLKHQIVGGHVSLWNMGLVFYRLILAGFDCREAIGKKYGYNISVIVPKKPNNIQHGSLNFDYGDIEKISGFFPKGYTWPHGFNGDLSNVNWP